MRSGGERHKGSVEERVREHYLANIRMRWRRGHPAVVRNRCEDKAGGRTSEQLSAPLGIRGSATQYRLRAAAAAAAVPCTLAPSLPHSLTAGSNAVP